MSQKIYINNDETYINIESKELYFSLSHQH